MTGAVAISSYALPGLHFEPTLADLQASSTAYVIQTLSDMIWCETRRIFTDLLRGKVQLLA